MPMFMQCNPCKTFRKSTLLQINQLEILTRIFCDWTKVCGIGEGFWV